MGFLRPLLLAVGFAHIQVRAQGGQGSYGGHGEVPGGSFGGGGAPVDTPGRVGFGGKPGATRPQGPWSGEGQTAGSPSYSKWLFQYPLPIPKVAQPEFTTTLDGRTIEYYSIEIQSLQQQVYPDLGKTNLVGYDGTVPGPTFMVERGHETVIRYLNRGNSDASVHLHGSYTHAPWDGWADDKIPSGSYKDYYYPNSENARSIWYHDHAEGSTASSAYYGQAGVYLIVDPAEDALGLPSGDYDVPLALTDKRYQDNGDLQPPDQITNSFGDIIEVNNQPWPYLSVEPRKYRFRVYDMSLSRPYDLYLEDADGNMFDFQVIASDSGLFGSPVTTSDLVISMGERYEIVVDFSGYKGQNVTLKNGLQVPVIDEFENSDKVMLFQVGNSVSDDSNNGDVPSTLNPNIEWPTPRDTVDHTFYFQNGGAAEWTINGVNFNDVNNRILAKPPQGTVERWRVVHQSGPAVHPVHIHLVNMQVVSRTGGSRGVLPYEAAGLKDVVLLEPGETVELLAYYGPWNGIYMFHCHNLIHEDNTMMAAFNVTLLESMGYNMSTAIGFSDPTDPRFAPQVYNAAEFEPAAASSVVASLASLHAYPDASSVQAAQWEYYSTAGFNGDNMASATATSTGSANNNYQHGYSESTATASGASQTGSDATQTASGASATASGASPTYAQTSATPAPSYGGPGRKVRS